MDTIYTGLMSLTKLDARRIRKGRETGQEWVRIQVIHLETPDKFGNQIIIQQCGDRANEAIIFGNAKNGEAAVFHFPACKAMPSKLEYQVETECSERNY